MSRYPGYPVLHVWQTDFGSVELTQEFVEEAQAKWPGELVLSGESWLDRLCGVERRTEPKWFVYVAEPLRNLVEAAYVAGNPIKRLKSIAALPDMRAV